MHPNATPLPANDTTGPTRDGSNDPACAITRDVTSANLEPVHLTYNSAFRRLPSA